jgi:hypothetical protein
MYTAMKFEEISNGFVSTVYNTTCFCGVNSHYWGWNTWVKPLPSINTTTGPDRNIVPHREQENMNQGYGVSHVANMLLPNHPSGRSGCPATKHPYVSIAQCG